MVAFSQPATYQIQVQGKVGDIPSDGVHVSELEVVVEAGDPDLIAFTGVVRDQAALNAVLNALIARKCIILKVQRLR